MTGQPPVALALACSGQPGQMRPGVAPVITVGGIALSGLLTAIGFPEAIPIIELAAGGLQWDVSLTCGSPDPGDPGLTTQDFLDLVDTSDILRSGAAGLKIHTWLQHMLWPTWCMCADGTSPGPSTTGALPRSGVNTGLPQGPTGVTCWDSEGLFGIAVPALQTYFNSLGPRTSDIPGSYPPGQQAQHYPSPLPTLVRATVTARGLTGAQNWSFDVQSLDSAGAPTTGGSIFSPSINGDGTYTGSMTPVSATDIGYRFFAQQLATYSPSVTFDAHLEFFCGTNTPSTPVVPCCPADPALDARLRRIEDLETVIIKLIGQGLRSHIDGTRHRNLTGAGSVVLVDSVDAIRVEITSDLTGHRVNPGVPSYFFSLGFITSIAAESPLKGWRLVYASQTYPIVSYADSIGYTLTPGVSIDLIELLPQ